MICPRCKHDWHDAPCTVGPIKTTAFMEGSMGPPVVAPHYITGEVPCGCDFKPVRQFGPNPTGQVPPGPPMAVRERIVEPNVCECAEPKIKDGICYWCGGLPRA